VQVQAEAVIGDASGNFSLSSTTTLASGSASIALSGMFIDVTGHVLFPASTA